MILEWGRDPIADANDLRIAVARTKVGSKVAVVLYREGKRLMLEVKVAPRPNNIVQ